MKKYIYIILIVLLALGLYLWKINTAPVVSRMPAPVVVESVNKRDLCFYQDKKGTNNLFDRQILILHILGDKVTGEYKNLPGEKDKKVGTFEGTVGAVDRVAMARTADVWWNSMAEGMQVKEQLKIVFGEGNAQAGYGEMVDRGDGTYVYKNASKLTYGASMTDVACDDARLNIK